MASPRSPFNSPVLRPFRGYRPRVLLVAAGMLLAGVVLAGRAFDLQTIQNDTLEELARRQSQRTISVKGRRGAIADRHGRRLAVSVRAQSLYAHPARVPEPAVAAFRLSRALSLPRRHLESLLDSERAFVWLKRQLTPREVQAVRALGVEGLGMTEEYRRAYPGREAAAAVLGFTGIDGQGLEGLEYAYDYALKGDEGLRVIDTDALGRVIVRGEGPPLAAGGSIRLTLHSGIQRIAERELERAVQLTEAVRGVAIVMDARTGELLALAHAPSFNPNAYQDYDKETYLNRAVTSGYEPGSTFKVVTVASALEEGLVRPDSLFFCENGRYEYYDSFIHDTRPHGWLSLEKVVQLSSNICAAKVGGLLPASVFHDYIKRFGFGERLDLFTTAAGRRLAAEAEGRVLPPEAWTPVDHAAISFGHGVLVSPLQLVTAINVIATGGELLKPILVSEVRDAEGNVVARHRRTVVRRVISGDTAATVRDFMKKVVQPDGTGPHAAIPGYEVAGKTGTTEKYDIQARGYSKTRAIASFAGFVPADDPRLTLLVLVDQPRRGRSGGVVAAPVFHRIAAEALPLLGVWPDTVRRIEPDPAPLPAAAAR